MKWDEIKKSITDDLNSRGLKDPGIRLRALANIESLMQQHFPSFINNPSELKQIGKEAFKRKIWDKKGRGLNSAEISIINEIYYRISPEIYLQPEVRDTISRPIPENGVKKKEVWIGAIVLIVLSILFSKTCSTDSSDPVYYIKYDTYAAISKEIRSDMVSYASQRDKYALNILLNNGLIVELDAGTEVFVDKIGFGYYVIRLKGSMQKLWINPDNVGKK